MDNEKSKHTILQQKRFRNFNPLSELVSRTKQPTSTGSKTNISTISDTNSLRLNSMSYIEYKQSSFNNAYIPVLPFKLISKK